MPTLVLSHREESRLRKSRCPEELSPTSKRQRRSDSFKFVDNHIYCDPHDDSSPVLNSADKNTNNLNSGRCTPSIIVDKCNDRFEKESLPTYSAGTCISKCSSSESGYHSDTSHSLPSISNDNCLMPLSWKRNNSDLKPNEFNDNASLNDQYLPSVSLNSFVCHQPQSESITLHSISPTNANTLTLTTIWGGAYDVIPSTVNSMGLTDLVNHKLRLDAVSSMGFESNQPLVECISKDQDADCISEDQKADRELLVKPVDDDLNTLLHQKIMEEDEEEVERIIRKATAYDDLNISNIYGLTPLHLAVESRLPKIVRRLMCAGAFVSIMDHVGNTPLHTACILGYTEVVDQLTQAIHYRETVHNKYEIAFSAIPQNMSTTNEDGQTCLDLAKINKNFEIYHKLKDFL